MWASMRFHFLMQNQAMNNPNVGKPSNSKSHEDAENNQPGMNMMLCLNNLQILACYGGNKRIVACSDFTLCLMPSWVTNLWRTLTSGSGSLLYERSMLVKSMWQHDSRLIREARLSSSHYRFVLMISLSPYKILLNPADYPRLTMVYLLSISTVLNYLQKERDSLTVTSND